MQLKAILLVGLGGFLGSITRYLVSIYLGKISFWGATFPATLIVNVIGCLIIGLLMGFTDKLSKEQLLITATGFCGGFTTFSTFSLESMHFLQKGDFKMGLLYMASSLFLGLAFTTLGFWVAKSI